MRFLQAVLLLTFLGAVLVFAVQNMQAVTLQFLHWRLDAPIALLVGVIYLLGMLSGWTVVAFVGRSLRIVAERPQR
jgi:putative membrane protein